MLHGGHTTLVSGSAQTASYLHGTALAECMSVPDVQNSSARNAACRTAQYKICILVL